MEKMIIKAKGLQKAYGKNNFALNSLDLNVPEGVVYGLLGKNGAGKTTTLRIIMSLIKASSGEVEVLGQNPWNMTKEIRSQIGYTSDSMQLIPWLRVGDILNYNGSFYETWDKEYVAQWVKRLNLPLEKRVFSLSRGTRQKLGLIMAIGHRPKLLVLDEPAGGLDPLARKEFLESIIELIHESGTTIILSSHLLSDLERISDYIGIIDEGKMKVENTLETLKNTTKQVKIISRNPIKVFQDSNIIKAEIENNVAKFIFKDWNDKLHQNIKQTFSDSTIEITSLDLEEIFMSFINNK